MVLLTNPDTKLATDHGMRQKRSQERQYIFDTVRDVNFIWNTKKTKKTKTKTEGRKAETKTNAETKTIAKTKGQYNFKPKSLLTNNFKELYF